MLIFSAQGAGNSLHDSVGQRCGKRERRLPCHRAGQHAAAAQVSLESGPPCVAV